VRSSVICSKNLTSRDEPKLFERKTQKERESTIFILGVPWFVPVPFRRALLSSNDDRGPREKSTGQRIKTGIFAKLGEICCGGWVKRCKRTIKKLLEDYSRRGESPKVGGGGEGNK